MNRPWYQFFIPALFLFLTACEKAIDFAPDETEPSLVIEATIENDQAPVVILTTSLGYFSQIDEETLQNSFVHDAVVTMSNGTQTHQLKEYTIPLPGGYSAYYYSIDSSDLATAFEGALNHSYSLSVEALGSEYTASTTIPALAKTIDSLWWVQVPAPGDSSEVTLMSRITDPPGLGNYIRYFTRVNNNPFYPGLTSVYDDQIVDGKTYDIQIEQGVNRNQNIVLKDYSFFHHGDSVTVKFCNIDKATFDFWRTMEFSYASVGNPFSTPTKVISNINGNALGYFGGYAVQYISLVIPE